MLSAVPVPRKITRKVGFGPLSSNNADGMNKCTRGGNNYKIDAHTINMCSNRTNSTTHNLALIPLKGFVAEFQKNYD